MILPVGQFLVSQGEYNINPNIIPSWIGVNIYIYPLVGYFLRYRLKEYWNTKKIILLGITNIILIVFAEILTYYRAQIMGVCEEGTSQMFHATFALINASCIFVTCQHIFLNIKVDKNMFFKLICSMGECSLGIYLMHMYVKDKFILFKNIISVIQNSPITISPLIYAFCYCGIIFFISYIITCIIKKIPIINRLV